MPSINQFVAPKSPLQGLSELGSIIGQVKDWSNKSKQADILDQEVKAKDLANKKSEAQNMQDQQTLAGLQDPDSPETQSVRAQAHLTNKALLNSGVLKGNEQQLNDFDRQVDAMPGIQIKNTYETSPLLKTLTGLGESSYKAQSMQPLALVRQEQVNNQKDTIAAKAADHFDNDAILNKINKQKQQIDLDMHTLENAKTLTPQLINEVQQGIANAISGGGSAGLGKTEQVELQTAKQKLADIQQRITSDPTSVNDPALVDYLHGTLSRLGDAYNKNGYARAQQIFKGRSGAYKSNPAAVQVMGEKLESYKPEPSASGTPAPGGHQTVQQNGHTYNWNSQSGKYE